MLRFKEFVKFSYVLESEYVVQKGDNLSSIAKKLGFADWKSLYDENKDVIGKNPGSLKAGIKLKYSEESQNKKEISKQEKVVDSSKLFINPLDTSSPIAPIDFSKFKVTKEKQYKKWDDIKKRLDSINSMPQHEIIKEYNKDIQGKYLILDKKKGEMKLYQGNRELGTFEVLTGKNEGDKQTKTVIRDGKVYWEEGNKMTGAGTYIVSGVNPKNTHYSNAPTWNFKNEKGEEVPMAIHSAFGNRFSKLGDKNQENNRLSNGCINGNPKDLIKIYNNGYQLGSLLYVLPDNPDNKFQIINGKLLFRSKDPEVNRTVKSLNYIPIKVEIEKERFKKEVFQSLDLDDELEYNRSTKPFIEALEKGKKKVMKAAKIDGDVYNDLAKIAFGIYGTESNFGDTHSPYGNLVRAGKKVLNPSSSSSPDYVSKATLYMQNKDSNSVGPTQIRFNMLDQTEKNILKQLGITDNMQLLNSWYAALGTVGILASRYINQLTAEEKKDPMTNLPKKWNVRKNYPDRVKQNSKYVTIKELH